MKTLLTTVAGAALLAAPVIAQNMEEMDGLFRSRDITGNNIYSTSADGNMDWNLEEEYEDMTSFEEIGEIEDLAINRDGEVQGLVAEVGGFLDIGDKHVLMPVEDLKIVESGGEPYYVTRLSEEELEEMPSVDQGWWD